MRTIRVLPMLALLGIFAACSSSDDKPKPPESAEQLYLEAREEFDKKNYADAVKAFEEVERQHPSSEWAINAQVMSGYASYKGEKYDDAVATLERFVKLFPNSESTPYAYYLL